MAEKLSDEESSNNDMKDEVKVEGDGLLKLKWGFMVKKMMMNELPSHWFISKEAREAMRECTTKFITFVTTQANVKCKKEKRVELSGDDVSWALEILGFTEILDPTH